MLQRNRSRKIYLAAPIFNPAQLEVVNYLRDTALDHGHEVFSPYHNSVDIWQGRAPKDCSPEERRRVLDDNIDHIDWADLMLAWVGGMGGFTDPGVVWEMGYAYAEEVYTLAYIDEGMDAERQSMNLMLAGTIDAVCRTRPEVTVALAMLFSEGQAAVTKLFPSSVLGQELEPIV